ncbi:MAG: aldo/keto reductase [Candidatus Eiseniibacteriota bacterium]|nr:MAG: aldo/keto reductase [Candidatus Eisenbacteria bacterium]
MQFVQLGKSDLKASRIGFGCWAIGGTDWGPVDDGESVKAIRKALDCGINFFDTADVYGGGHSEEVLAKALGAERKKVLVATKVAGVKKKGSPPRLDTSHKHILEAIEASLSRLRTDYVDLYQIHAPDHSTPVKETMSTLMELKEQGKIRHIGLSNMNVKDIGEYMEYGPVTTLQPEYSMIQRQSEKELFPFCLESDIGVLAYSPLGRGLLTGKYTRESTFPLSDLRAVDAPFQGKIFEINLRCVERLRKPASDSGRTLAQLAVAWTLSNPAVSVSLVGAKTTSQVEENAAAFDSPLSSGVIEEIAAILKETEDEKETYKKEQIASLATTPITEVRSEDAGREIVDALILWMMELHGTFDVSSQELRPLFAVASGLKATGTVGKESELEDIRTRLVGIHSGLEAV